MPLGAGDDLFAGVRDSSREGFEEGHTELIDVARRRRFAADEVLGSHVGHRTDEIAGLGQARGPVVGRLDGEAEVGQVSPPFAVDDDVGRLHVTVEDPRLVQLGQGRGNVDTDGDDGGYVEGRPKDEILQGLAGDEFHGEACHVALFVVVEEPYDVGVAKPCMDDALALKSSPDLGSDFSGGSQHLQGHLAAQPLVGGAEHGPHAALAQLFEQAIPGGGSGR